MGITDRIRKLERGAPEPRCENCKDWPDFEVIDANDQTTMEPLEVAPPVPCPRCGFSPMQFRVIHVDDGRWR
jgi:hypothetical protein